MDTVKFCHSYHRRVDTAHLPFVLGYRVLSAYPRSILYVRKPPSLLQNSWHGICLESV